MFMSRSGRGGGGKKSSRPPQPLYRTSDDMPPILPKLLVFDLDNTLWTPELYQLRQRTIPKAGRDIRLFDCARTIVSDLAANPAWADAGTQLAIASRTNKIDWAERLLRKFDVAAPVVGGISNKISLDDLFVYKEIVPGSKRRHFENLREQTGVKFSDMVFFDDDMHMNLGEVSSMGVLCCHTPRGITVDLFRGTLGRYHEMKAGHPDQWMGITVTSADLDVSGGSSSGVNWEEENEEGESSAVAVGGAGRKAEGRVKFYSAKKRFGFVVEDGGDGDGGGGGDEGFSEGGGMMGDEFFFHESKIAAGVAVETGMRVRFETLVDSRGRPAAAILAAAGGGGTAKKRNGSRRKEEEEEKDGGKDAGGDPSRTNNAEKASPGGGRSTDVRMPCFSMSQPFAALLLNGIKTIETRNNPMFMNVKPGTTVLLHCGMRDWKDVDAPKIELRKAGYADEEIRRLSSLPPGFRRGDVIGTVEVGRTWRLAPRERRGPNMQRRVVACEENVAEYATIVEKADWLKGPVRKRGFPGIQMVDVPKGLLPK